MRRYIIYAMVYGTLGVCVGLAMAYVSKDVKYPVGITLRSTRPRVVPETPSEPTPQPEPTKPTEDETTDAD